MRGRANRPGEPRLGGDASPYLQRDFRVRAWSGEGFGRLSPAKALYQVAGRLQIGAQL